MAVASVALALIVVAAGTIRPSTSQAAVACEPSLNLFGNPGFETGSLPPWTVLGTNPTPNSYDGAIYEGRSLGYQSNTTTPLYAPYGTDGNLCVCLMGNFQNQEPTPAALGSLQKLLAFLLAKHNLSPARLHEQRELTRTVSPGKHLSDWLKRDRTASRRGSSRILRRADRSRARRGATGRSHAD